MTVVISPHVDDAIFSIGAYLSVMPSVIITPFAGVPADPEGEAKHLRLRREHQDACYTLGARAINGTFLDDVYEAPPRRKLYDWLAGELLGGEDVYIPLGLHHPDHVVISNLMIRWLNAELPGGQVYFYAELPYRVDYPELTGIRYTHVENTVGRLRLIEDYFDDTLKAKAVDCYASQVGGTVRERVMVRERVWELVR